jgi:hypothetical protein
MKAIRLDQYGGPVALGPGATGLKRGDVVFGNRPGWRSCRIRRRVGQAMVASSEGQV